jgi:hypothetical protein
VKPRIWVLLPKWSKRRLSFLIALNDRSNGNPMHRQELMLSSWLSLLMPDHR